MDWASITDVGTRAVNEDSLGTAETEQAQCFIVADGLGGHGMGDVASGLAVAAFKKVFEESSDPIEQRLEAAFEQAQKDILEEQIKNHAQLQMKTTAAVLAVAGDQLVWAHIGDTRVYAFAHNRVKTRSVDHSVPQMLVLAKEIKENQIRNHPDRNKLLRVLGVSGEKPRYEMSGLQKRKKYQAFLLCSDGFWELVLEKEMQKCLKKAKTAQQWLELMEQIVRQRGEGTEMDNFSAVAVLL